MPPVDIADQEKGKKRKEKQIFGQTVSFKSCRYEQFLTSLLFTFGNFKNKP